MTWHSRSQGLSTGGHQPVSVEAKDILYGRRIEFDARDPSGRVSGDRREDYVRALHVATA